MALALQIVKLAALTVLTVILVMVALFIPRLTSKVDYTIDNANRAIRESAETAANLRHATAEWERASQAQAVNATAASLAAKKSFEDFDAMVRRTDFQLNEQVLPQIGQAIATNSAQLVELQKTSTESFGRIANDADQLTADANEAMTAATRHLEDPTIDGALKNLEKTSAETAATATDIRQVADKIRADYLHPSKFLWSLVKELAGFGGSIAQMMK